MADFLIILYLPYIFLGVIPIDETVSIPYIEPFYCFQNLCFEEDLIRAGGCHYQASTTHIAACGA